MDRLNAWAPLALGILRIVAALLFIEHGTQKLFGFPAGEREAMGLVFTLPGIAGMLEVFGGALLLLGLFTRPVAFILSGEMAAAYFMGHVPHGSPLLPMLNQGERAVQWCFLFLDLAAAGAGAWSVDNALSRPRTAAAA